MLSKDKTLHSRPPWRILMIIYHKALSCKHSDPIWTTLIFFWKKKSLKKNTENSISEIIDFKIFESIPLEPIATLTADLKPNLWQTPVGNFRINGLGLTQTKRKNIYRKCFFNQVVSCCVFVLPHALSKYYLMKMKVSRSLHFS